MGTHFMFRGLLRARRADKDKTGFPPSPRAPLRSTPQNAPRIEKKCSGGRTDQRKGSPGGLDMGSAGK